MFTAAICTVVLGAGPVWRFHCHEVPILEIPGAIWSNPIDINDLGQVTGESGANQTAVGLHAFLWSAGSKMLDLDEGAWPSTSGHRINNAGMIAGDAVFCPQQDGACQAQPIVIDSEGMIVPLEAVWSGYLAIQAINAVNTVIYNRTTSPSTSTIAPRQWTPEGGLSWLPLPNAIYNGYATALNDHNVIVGYALGPSGYQPTVWIDGMLDLLSVEPDANAWPRDVNNNDVIVGSALAEGAAHAVRWATPSAVALRLITDPAVEQSEATIVLDDGTVLGDWRNDANQMLTFRIAPDGTVDLLIPPPHPNGTLDLTPVAGIDLLGDGPVQGWILGTHMSEFYEVEPAMWIPEEGWVLMNQRLVGPGSAPAAAPAAMNSRGDVVTRGSSFWTPYLLTPMPPGDVNGDQVVDVVDLLAVIEAWGSCTRPGRVCDPDVNADGLVNVEDVLGVIGHWD